MPLLKLINFIPPAIISEWEEMMQGSNQNLIHLIGPLTVDIKLKVQHPAQLIGDRHFAKNQGITMGGPVLQIARVLHSLGYPVAISSYVGNDEFGNKIIENIKEEGIEADIQKLPNTGTPITCKLNNKQDYSSYTTSIADLTLWEFRLKSFNPTGVVFIHPSTPVHLQLEIIKRSKNAKILVQKPLDSNLEIFKADRELIIMLNEYDAFEIFRQFFNGYFSTEKVLQSEVMKKHKVLIESKYDFKTLDETRTVKTIAIEKNRINHTRLDEYAVAGVLGGLYAKRDYLDAFLWGLGCAIQSSKPADLNKLDLIAKSNQLSWK